MKQTKQTSRNKTKTKKDKIVQLVLMPNDSKNQGKLLALTESGKILFEGHGEIKRADLFEPQQEC